MLKVANNTAKKFCGAYLARPRLIPCLILKNGQLIRSQGFKTHQVIGNPVSTIMRFSNWNVDELVVLDISKKDFHDLKRDDLQIGYKGSSIIDILGYISRVCFMPLSVGGRIRTLEDIRLRLFSGSDKCIINTKAIEEPSFIGRAARHFGSQCIVVSIDVKKKPNGEYEVYSNSGTKPTGMNPAQWAKLVEREGAGEIFLNSIDRDGSALGYDVDLIKSVTKITTIPVIACGGVGKYEDFPKGIIEAGASAVSAANIFHFFELTYPLAKKACLDADISMRPVKLDTKWFSREPIYDNRQEEDAKRNTLRTASMQEDKRSKNKSFIKWCKKCLYPAMGANLMEFDDKGICMGCRMSEMKQEIPKFEWDMRRKLLADLLEKYRSKDGSRHDCVIGVSGGKDSYFITHVIRKEFGLNPLLVTYNANNYLPVGWHNLLRMKEVFGVDHIIYTPNVQLLKKLNRLGFTIMGDMNWHAHIGIMTIPVRIAAQNKIPLVFWGEHGYLDYSGQFSMNDFPEMSYRDRLEHYARGYEWNYMVGREGITSNDMIPYKYPTDQELLDIDIRGIYLGNYVYWEANEHAKLMVEKYNFKKNNEPFDRTYRRISNVDDMHENGLHDYLKYIKFGYGRCTDHVGKDIRAGLMTTEKGIELIKKYDHVIPRDLKRWLEYTEMTEEEFFRIADTFRDPRVWRQENGYWVKDTPWGKAQEHEKVSL